MDVEWNMCETQDEKKQEKRLYEYDYNYEGECWHAILYRYHIDRHVLLLWSQCVC